MWIYHQAPWIVFLATFSLIFAASWCGYALGARTREEGLRGDVTYLSEYFPSTILSILALILGFTFSLAISRFEGRRQLVVAEANAIGTAYLRARLLQAERRAELANLIRGYLDLRIEFYEEPVDSARAREIDARTQLQQQRIWNVLGLATRKDRGVFESGAMLAINSMFDLGNERTIALSKTLPPMIYWSILFIAAIGVATLNFVRGKRREAGQWQPGLLIIAISFVFVLVLDLDRPTVGTIQITQQAMTSLQKFIRDYEARSPACLPLTYPFKLSKG